MEVGTISIRYGDLALIAQRLRSVKDAISMSADQTDLNFQLDACYRAEAYLAPLLSIKTDLARTVEEFESLAKLLDEVAAKCEEKERGIKTGLANIVAAEGFSGSTAPPPGHANEYYGAIDQKKKEEDDARDAEEKRKAKREAILAYFAERFPLAYAAYMEKVNAAADEAWLEELKNSDDPEDQAIYEMIMEQKRAEEEARKAAEEAAKAGEAGDTGLSAGELAELDESGLGGGGGGSLGDLGSDLGLGGGGGGGFGELGSGWESDLLDDAIDSGELMDAEGALSDIASPDNPAATDTGMDAATGDGVLEEAEAGVLGAFGDKLASLAAAYGLQAAAVAGAGIALYATREQTTEAVAHVAEFVSTRCKPFASDVMDQVSGAAKKTRVNLGNAKSRVVAAARGEEVGDLIA